MSPEFVAETAGVVGYLGGLVGEQLAVRHAAKNQANLSEAMGLALEKDNVHKVSLSQRAARTLLAPLALTAGVAIGLEAYANAPGEIIERTPAVLEVVVDHSAATGLELGGKPTVSTINSLATKLIDKQSTSEALVAGSDVVKTLKANQINSDQPFGAAPLTQATTYAVSKAGTLTRSASEKAPARSSGVVLITNGNNLIGAPVIAAKAKAQQTPLYVVNVERSNEATKATAQSLRQLADASKGKYWNANETNLSTITQAIVHELRPNQTKHSQLPNRNLLRIFGVVGLAAVAGQYVGRKNKTIGRGAKGE